MTRLSHTSQKRAWINYPLIDLDELQGKDRKSIGGTPLCVCREVASLHLIPLLLKKKRYLCIKADWVGIDLSRDYGTGAGMTAGRGMPSSSSRARPLFVVP